MPGSRTELERRFETMEIYFGAMHMMLGYCYRALINPDSAVRRQTCREARDLYYRVWQAHERIYGK